MSTNKIDDGGPAFPCDWKDFVPTTGEQVVREQFFGMSVRTWLAGKALSGILSNQDLLEMIDEDLGYDSTKEGAAKYALLVADSMIKAMNQ